MGLELFRYLAQGRWSAAFGYVLFIATMATGDFYSLAFARLGLVDFGTRHIGLGESRLAVDMTVFALVTSPSALASGIGFGLRRFVPRTIEDVATPESLGKPSPT